MNLLSKPFLNILIILCGLISCSLSAYAQDVGDDSTIVYPLSVMQRSDSLFFDAMKARMQNDKPKAHESLLAFTTQRPKEPTGWYELSRSYLADKKIEKATESIRKAISLDGDNKWYKDQYSRILEANSQYKDAADVLSKLARNEKYNAEYLYRAAKLYWRADKLKDAHEMMDALIAKEGEEEEYIMVKVELYKKQNDLEKAAEMIERLITANPLEGRYYAALAELYETNGESKKAEAVYKRAMNVVPDDPMLQLSLAIRSKINQDSAGYSENLKKMALNKSLDVNTQLQVLDQYVQESFKEIGKRQEALNIAEQLAKQHPKDAQVAYSYGRVLVLNNQPEKAIEQYKRSLDIDQSNVEVWSRLMDVFTTKDKADSLKYYSDKALKLFPNLAAVHYYSGLASYNKEDYPTAIKTLNRALDMLPEEDKDMLSRLHATLGEIYNTTKEYKLSDENYRKSLEADPNNFLVLNNFAYFLSVRGENLEEAERMSRLTLELVPNEATFMDTYGWILYKQGKYTKAKEFVQKALDKSENVDGTLYDHMGDIYFQLKDKEKALEYWQKAKEKGTDNPLIDKKIQEQKLYE